MPGQHGLTMLLPSMKRRRRVRRAYLDGGGREELRELFARRHGPYPDAHRSEGAAGKVEPRPRSGRSTSRAA